MESSKVSSGTRKVKKKQVKDELDRLKQAEKKKRRLEKALATSAAIRSELEKKKQKKKEEQQRLDEEGAAIAEAVALQVLIEEDSDNSCKVVLNKDEGFNSWDCAGNFSLLINGSKAVLPRQGLSNYSVEGIGWLSDAHGYACPWNNWRSSGWTVSSEPFESVRQMPYIEDGVWETPAEVSADMIAAQAVSSLQIAEDGRVDALVFNRLCRG